MVQNTQINEIESRILYSILNNIQKWNNGNTVINNRKQIIKTSDTFFNEQMIKCGVPQGTTSSQILFNVELYDIKLLKLKSQIVRYADDISLDLYWQFLE